MAGIRPVSNMDMQFTGIRPARLIDICVYLFESGHNKLGFDV